MRITIITLGSHGDVLPYLTLGKRLQDAGHQVGVATFQNFEPLVTARGLVYHPLRGDSRQILTSPLGRQIGQAGRNTLRMARSMLASFGSLAEGYAHDLNALAELETSLFITQLPGGLYGYDLAEKLGARLMLASVIPLAPTATRPMLAFPSALARLPGYNLASHWVAYQIVWQGFRRTIDRWRRQTLGLSRAPLAGYFKETWREIPVINGFSAHVVPRPADWGKHIHITGYWFPEEETWEPPTALSSYLQAGPPPVFIGFGSMPLEDPAGATATILAALRESGQRGILQSGWGGLASHDLPDYAFKIRYAPYRWLFPQMAAIVHHGGSGTTAHGFRSGVPTVIVPFTFDQFYWGQRAHALGAGPEPIPYQKLTGKRLAAVISQAVSDPRLRTQSQELARRIEAENGVDNAVQVIESSL